jgi:hypothetical protein
MNRQKLTDFTKALGSHFVKVSQAHTDLADSCEPDSPAQQAHQSIAESSADMSEKCLECLKVLVAASESDFSKFERDFSQVMPTQVSAIVPDTPSHARTRAVPRYGAPPVSAAMDADPELAKLFTIEDGS